MITEVHASAIEAADRTMRGRRTTQRSSSCEARALQAKSPITATAIEGKKRTATGSRPNRPVIARASTRPAAAHARAACCERVMRVMPCVFATGGPAELHARPRRFDGDRHRRGQRCLRTPRDRPGAVLFPMDAFEVDVVDVDALEPLALPARLALGLFDRLHQISDGEVLAVGSAVLYRPAGFAAEADDGIAQHDALPFFIGERAKLLVLVDLELEL